MSANKKAIDAAETQRNKKLLLCKKKFLNEHDARVHEKKKRSMIKCLCYNILNKNKTFPVLCVVCTTGQLRWSDLVLNSVRTGALSNSVTGDNLQMGCLPQRWWCMQWSGDALAVNARLPVRKKN